MKTLWGILLIAVLVACSPSSLVSTPASIANTISTNTALPPSEIIPSKTIPPLNNLSTSTPVTAPVKVISPSPREVKLSDLGLGDTTRLILYYQPSNSLRIMSGQDVQPQIIPDIDPEAWIWNSRIEISPDQKWFIYQVSKGIKDDIAYFDYWLSSTDGKEQKIAVSNVPGGTEVRWANNEQIELWDYPSGQRVCPHRVSITNPFTQEALTLPEIPTSIKPQCFFDLSTSPDYSKIIYFNKDGLWSIYDLNRSQSQDVFPWLSKSERFALWPRFIQWSTNGITMVLPGKKSISFIADLSPLNVSDSNVAWKKFWLPNGKKIYNDTFSWWKLDKGLVGFDLIDDDYNYAEGGDTSPQSNFVIFDLKNSVLYDYNLDRALSAEIQKRISPFVFASANNRFLAWTIYEPPDMSHASETVVLDRETGRIARIQGYEFFGWGEVDQP